MGRPYAKRYMAICLGPCQTRVWESTRPGKYQNCPSCVVKLSQLANTGAFKYRDQPACRKVAHTSMAG